MDENGSSIGGGFADVTQAADTFTLLNIPINYGPGNPYRAFVSMTIDNDGTTGLPTIGTYFIVDDISMGDVVSGVDDAGNLSARSLHIFPNPSSSALTISFSMPKSELAAVGLYDLTGRRVSQIFEGELRDGAYIFEANVDTLNSGLYYCLLSTPSGTACQKLSVVH